jgi:hypothetical protein
LRNSAKNQTEPEQAISGRLVVAKARRMSSGPVVRRASEFASMEFDADHLSRSPKNRTAMFGAVRGYHQRKLRRKPNRADYLQPGSGFGLVTNETGNR